MSTLSQHDALDPNGPLYYAPPNVRGGFIDPQSIRLQPDTIRQSEFEPSAPPPKPLHPAYVEDELPEAFRRLVENEFKSYSRRARAPLGVAAVRVCRRRQPWCGRRHRARNRSGRQAGCAGDGAAESGCRGWQHHGQYAAAARRQRDQLPRPSATVELSGLLAGAVVSAGTASAPGQWRLNVDDLPTALVTPPQDYVGAMELVAEVQAADGHTLASEPLRLYWRAGARRRAGRNGKTAKPRG